MLVAAALVLNARRYVGSDDVLGPSAPATTLCNSRGSGLTISVPKSALASCSGPIRQLVNGDQQVVIKGYVLHRDKDDPSQQPAPGFTKLATYTWYAPQAGQGMILLMVFEHDDSVVVSVNHHEFGFSPWGR